MALLKVQSPEPLIRLTGFDGLILLYKNFEMAGQLFIDKIESYRYNQHCDNINVPIEKNMSHIDTVETSQSELPSVNDMAVRLKERIRAYKGGCEAVWRQLDERFKADGGKSIDGLKGSGEKRITHSAFMKAFQRLGYKADSALLERMNFQINGNPLLLMNIFEILGINGYKDLLNVDFKKPDIIDEIVYIDTKIEEIIEKINVLDENIENYGTKSIKSAKLNADFEEITNRLYSILLENVDPLLKDVYYVLGKNESMKLPQFNSAEYVIDPENYHKKINEKIEKMRSNKFFLAKVYVFLYDFKEESKRVVSMMMLFFDYNEYLSHNKDLRKYKKELIAIPLKENGFSCTSTYILCPLFVMYFYLQIAILFLERIKEESFLVDANTKEYILEISETNSVKNYLETSMKRLIKEIKTILNYFNKDIIKEIPEEKYTSYLQIAISIIMIAKTLFIDNKKDNQVDIKMVVNKYRTLGSLYKSESEYVSGVYTVKKSTIEEIEHIANEINTIRQATGRDLNG
jgi:hypothetical protein